MWLGIFNLPLTLVGQKDIIDDRNENTTYENRFVQANIFFLQEKYHDAIKILETLLQEDRRNHAVAYQLSKAYYALDQKQKSYEFIDRAVRLEPANIWYRLFKTKILEEEARYLEAAAEYHELIQLEPSEFEFYKQKANNLSRAGNYIEAAETLANYENEFGTFEEILQRKYDLYMAAGQLDLAAEEIEQLCLISPNNTYYLHLLAAYYATKNQTHISDSLYLKILQIDPSDFKATIALQSGRHNNIGYAERLATLAPIIENPKINVDAKILELMPLLESFDDLAPGEIKDLISICQQLTITHPQNAKSFSIYGDVLKLNKQYLEAIQQYSSSLSLDKSNFAIFDEKIYLHFLLGQFQEMIKTIELALDYYPNQVKLYLWSSLAFMYSGKPDRALQELQHARLMAQNSPALLARVEIYSGIAHLFNNDLNKAFHSMESGIKLFPDSEELLSLAIYYLTNTDDSNQKVNQLINLMSSTISKNPTITIVQARNLIRQGKKIEGQKLLTDSLAKSNEPDFLEYIGDCYALLGDQENAIKYWNQSIKAGGKIFRLQKKIQNQNALQ